ncbi:helix-turn-helix domain-containing protein [Mesorhizobium sp. M0306]|uniref:helix-turn-helix transcriptional regulator n=1 Tax=Mesorhizobium sp. M0306 TaxID=2956932 RepID=UPI0033391F20
MRKFDASSEAEPGGMLVCVEQGEVRLLGPSGRWTLPAGFMVYIPTMRPYRLVAANPATVTLVKFTASETDWRHPGCWTVPIPVLAREMVGYSRRWNCLRDPADALANSFYEAIGRLFADWFDRKRAMWTPFGKAPEMQRAISFARANFDSVCVAEAASAAGMSERTLRRRFRDELGISWREFITELKMNKAMELLRNRQSVTETPLRLDLAVQVLLPWHSKSILECFLAYFPRTLAARSSIPNDRLTIG